MDVDLRRAELAVPEDFFHVNGWNAGTDEMRGVGVSEGVRGGPHVEPSAAPVVSNKGLNGANRERAVMAVLKER